MESCFFGISFSQFSTQTLIKAIQQEQQPWVKVSLLPWKDFVENYHGTQLPSITALVANCSVR
jgi:hypothetical protein